MLYHIDMSDDPHHDFRMAFANAVAKVIESDASEMAIAVNDIESLDTFIYPVLFGVASRLKESGYTDLSEIRLYLETREQQSKLTSGVIIASYVSDDYLQELLMDTRATDVIFVTNKTEVLENYLLNNNSKPIGNDG